MAESLLSENCLRQIHLRNDMSNDLLARRSDICISYFWLTVGL